LKAAIAAMAPMVKIPRSSSNLKLGGEVGAVPNSTFFIDSSGLVFEKPNSAATICPGEFHFPERQTPKGPPQ
jgi:hypothetical protein